MKTSISIPDELFDAIERIVRDSNRSRSEVYAGALREYLVRHDPHSRTEAINAALANVGDMTDELNFVHAAAYQVFSRIEW